MAVVGFGGLWRWTALLGGLPGLFLGFAHRAAAASRGPAGFAAIGLGFARGRGLGLGRFPGAGWGGLGRDIRLGSAGLATEASGAMGLVSAMAAHSSTRSSRSSPTSVRTVTVSRKRFGAQDLDRPEGGGKLLADPGAFFLKLLVVFLLEGQAAQQRPQMPKSWSD